MRLAAEMATIAKVLELGSFTAAARALGVPKVRVSRDVASLERRLGLKLLTRTTRRLALTPAGALLMPHCQRVLAEAEAALRLAAQPLRRSQQLRVIADSGWGRLLLMPLVPRFLELNPGLTLQVEMVPERPTEPSEAWDVLVCQGAPQGAAFAVRSLGQPPLILCATSAYLEQRGTPERPEALASHAILIAAASDVNELRLVRGHERAIVPLTPRLLVADPQVVHSSTAAGLGIGVLPEFLCRQGLAMGRLLRVLPQWSAAELLELCAVCDARVFDAGPVRGFIDFLAAHMVPALAAPPA